MNENGAANVTRASRPCESRWHGRDARVTRGGCFWTSRVATIAAVLSSTRWAVLLVLCVTTVANGAPPKVIKATPDNGAADVDPALKQIVIQFDQPMNQGGRSIVGGGPRFLKIEKITWQDDRTIVIDVTLEPEHDYWLSINSNRFTNFRSAKGEPCVPYPISFTTAADKNAAKLDPALNKQAIEQLRKAIDDDYSYRDLRKIDWGKVFSDGAPALEKAPSARAFAKQAGEMLAVAQDIHLSLHVGDTSFPSARRSVPGNLNFKALQTLVPNWQEHNGVVTGRFDDGITYLMIGAWSNDIAPAMEQAYAALADADPKKGMVIDVRPNSGGNESLARQFAGCFVDRPRLYSKNTNRRDGKWLGPFDRMVEPNKARPAYRGPVAVLIGRRCMSSNESFILMMKSAGATLVGETTYGSSGNPKPHELANGVTVLLPSWKDLRPDGTCLEGEGIVPNVEVKAQPPDFDKADPVLDAALKVLREPK